MSDSPFKKTDDESSSELDEALIRLYVRHAIPVDALAYSETFDDMFSELQAKGEKRSKGDVYRRLLTLRKAGMLPRLMPVQTPLRDSASA